ncbi:MAG: hypothetical protein EOP49_04670 [Sphingobacteriales bacterium]|nr:MAG: hypothetical protein EOP49_04670 [Sphingobacteriales bacterium]
MKWIPEEVQSKGIKFFLDKIREMPQEAAADEYYEFASGAKEDPLYKTHEEFRTAVDEMFSSAVALKQAVEEKNAVEMAGAQAEAELILAKDTVADALRESRRRLIIAYNANPDTPGLRELLDEMRAKEMERGTYREGDWEGYE